MEEEWRDIDGFEGHYMVSNTGRVKSIKFGKERIIRRHCLMKSGYINICLHMKGKNKLYLHRVVAKAFLDTDPLRPLVNHKNGDKSDNRATNLELVTKRENQCHASLLKGKDLGRIGVRKHKNRYVATIWHNGGMVYIGSYKTPEEATSARMEYEAKNGISNKYLTDCNLP